MKLSSCSEVMRIALALIGMAGLAVSATAQTAQPLPSVDLRRTDLGWDVWPGDFNGDGITDLVASVTPPIAGQPSQLQVVLGRGNGTFSLPIVTNFTGRAIQVADFNGDRRVDVVASTTAPATQVVVLASRGDGTLAAPRPIDSGFGAFAVTGDFNGDTRRDLVLVGGPEVRVYPGRGDLTFGTPARFSIEDFFPDQDCLDVVPGVHPCGGGIAVEIGRAHV
jgi:hypothetical protein